MRHTRVIVTHYGGPDALQVLEEERPEPKAGEVRVNVLAAGVSLPDIMAREGVGDRTLLNGRTCGGETMRLLGGLVAISLLHGCATFREPESGPRARVRFVADSSSPSTLFKYNDAACSQDETRMANMKAGTMFGSETKRLGMPLWDGFHENAAKEFYVRANEPFYGFFSGRNLQNVNVIVPIVIHTYSVCRMPFAMRFLDGEDYEVRFNTIGSCSIQISRIRREGNGAFIRVPEPSALQSIDSTACLAAWRKKMSIRSDE